MKHSVSSHTTFNQITVFPENLKWREIGTSIYNFHSTLRIVIPRCL